MRKARFTGWIVAGVLALAPLGLWAQEPEAVADKPSAGEAESSAVGRIRLAAQLIKYGRAEQSAEALLLAVSILEKLPAQYYAKEKTSEGPGDAEGESQADESGQAKPLPLDTEKLLAEAETLAKSNEVLLALVEQHREPALKPLQLMGRTSGVIHGHRDTVLKGTKDLYTFKFKGKEIARMAVIGNGDSDLDLYVYDSKKALITKDEDETDDCIVQWFPLETAEFRIEIVNRGEKDNAYVVFTN